MRLWYIYISVTASSPKCNTLSDVEFILPPNPGPTVDYPQGGTQFQISVADKSHDLVTMANLTATVNTLSQ